MPGHRSRILTRQDLGFMAIIFHNSHTALQNDYDKDHFVPFHSIMAYVIF